MKVKIVKLIEEAIVPVYSTEGSAGADLFNPLEDIVIKAKQTVMIKTGLSMEIEKGYAIFIYARSGISIKNGIAPANKVGVIDSDYRGEIMVGLYNHSDSDYTVNKGDKIAQMLIAPYIKGEFEVVDKLSDTVRNCGGFGSTGK